jgi:GTP cyclohydrolase IB
MQEHNYEWLEDDSEFASGTQKDQIARQYSTSNYCDTYISPIRAYDTSLVADSNYISSLPDLQNGPSSLIQGSPVAIQQVGIHNFRLPLKFKTREGGEITLETSITGTVSLEAHKKGINMSRIIRSFYERKDNLFTINTIAEVLDLYREKLNAFDARIMMKISYPIEQKSLRSGLVGYQYYDVTLEGDITEDGSLRKYMHFDFMYSSACPCSYELAQHAEKYRNRAVVSHSQRSTARVSVLFDKFIWIEELRDMCLNALKTETQVMVKREDEQAFAELNGAYLKFVEDAVRLLHKELDKDDRIKDFKVICGHWESLHSHDAVGVLVKGIPGGFRPGVPREVYESMLK